MRILLSAAPAATAALVTITSMLSAWAGAPADRTKPTPARLVEQALATELDGPSSQRETLLRQALSLDPKFAPARWALGYVRWDDAWLSLEEAAERAGSDERLAEYRKRRGAMADRADDHRQLARWCHKNRLTDEKRIHWAKVLEFDPRDGEALAALGLKLYEGRLLTQQQIVATKKQAGQRMRAMKHWRPQMAKWRKAIQRGGKGRSEALDTLSKLSAPEAIAALEATFADNREGAKTDELNLLLIETVGRMPLPAATQVLLRRAIAPDSRRVREAATDELKKRPMHAYVPQLIAATPEFSSTSGGWYVQLLPLGVVTLRAEFRQQQGRSRHSAAVDTLVTRRLEVVKRDPFGHDLDFIGSLVESLQEIDANARQQQQFGHLLRERARLVLARTTGYIEGDDPIKWWDQWNDYSERYSSRYDRPAHRDTYTTNYLRLTAPSCFPAGTPIQTIDGPLPIESVKVGDRILAQDVVSGELTFKLVQRRTLRPAAPLVEIRTGSTRVAATRGHPFWVNGQGWTMAKHLKAGDMLRGVDGAAVIDSIDEQPAKEAYNLVVADYGTYFAGEKPLLVHDNTPLPEILALVPGLKTRIASP